MKKKAFQFILKIFALAGYLATFLLLDSTITGRLGVTSGILLIFTAAFFSINLTYFALFTPIKSTKKRRSTSTFPKRTVVSSQCESKKAINSSARKVRAA